MKKTGFLIASLMLMSFKNHEKEHCEFSEETLSEHFVKIISYKPKNKNKEKGKIIILPPTGGVTYLEKKYAQAFCKNSFSAFIIKSWKGENERGLELEVHNRLLKRAQVAIGQLIKEKTDKKDFIGIFGTSVGAIHSATAFGFYDQIQAGFFILGGAPIHQIIAHSDESTLLKHRQKRKEKFHFKTNKDYATALDKALLKEVCPLYFSKKAKQKPSFLVIAKKDTKVPSIYQKTLAQAFHSQTLELSSGHIFGILRFWLFHKNKALQFFEKSYLDFYKNKT